MSIYIAKIKVTGCDHDGYCSGAEGYEIEPYYIYKQYTNINDIKDSHEPGCTNYSGSGYCRGCYIDYTVIGAYEHNPNDTGIKNIEDVELGNDYIKMKEEYREEYSVYKEKKSDIDRRIEELKEQIKNYEHDLKLLYSKISISKEKVDTKKDIVNLRIKEKIKNIYETKRRNGEKNVIEDD